MRSFSRPKSPDHGGRRTLTGRHRGVIAILLAVGLGLGWMALQPLTTRQGVNFHVTTKQLPAYVKAIDFLHRHYHYRLLARDIVRGVQEDEARALAILQWTRANIHPMPSGWPIIDDHILHIIIRGYGTSDQIADVFTTLTTYAGLPSFWSVVRVSGSEFDLILSFVEVDGRWVAFDVWNGVSFTDDTGRLASVGDLQRHPGLVRRAVGARRVGEVPYEQYLTRLGSLRVPRPLRAQLQMPWPRFWHEMRQLTTWGGREDADDS